MPSFLHESIVALFRNRPSLAPEVLEDSFAVTLPEYTEIRIEDSNLSEIIPTEYRADLVVLLDNDEPVLAIVVEVQFSRDSKKRMSWPVYLTALRARMNCPSCLLVVCTDESIADWYFRTHRNRATGIYFEALHFGPNRSAYDYGYRKS